MKIELEQVEPAEIESRSMEIIESELPHEIDPKLAPIIKRAVHTAADFDYVDNLCFSEDESIRQNLRSMVVKSSALWVMMTLETLPKRMDLHVQGHLWIRQQVWINH